MVNTAVDDTTLKATSRRVFSENSENSDTDADCDARQEELRESILRAKQLIRELSSHVMKSPMEENSFQTLKEECHDADYRRKNNLTDVTHTGTAHVGTKTMKVRTPERGNPFEGSIGMSGHDIVSNKDVLVTVSSLVNALDNSLRQIQQLKFKNMLIKSSSNDIQSTFEVEENLRKQQFERMKCQLLLDKQQLLETLHFKEGKIAKYKNRIVQKNRLINKLMRILNQNSIVDPLTNGDIESSRISSISVANTSGSRDKTNDMLKTLGLLASQVLNDEIDEDSANQTILQQPSGKLDDRDMSEAEIIDNSDIYADKESHLRGLTTAHVISDPKVVSRTPIKNSSHDDLHPSNVELPKMKSFSTVDGTIRDIS